MRILMTLALCLSVSAQASAQQAPARAGAEPGPSGECLSVSPTSRVVVDTSEGHTLRGTLMCLSDSGAWLLRDGRLSEIPLADVRRVRTTADPVWDGAAKGAVIPLIVWLVLCHDCSAEPMLKATLTYGLIGLSLDALDTNRRTLYQGYGRKVSVGWTFSF